MFMIYPPSFAYMIINQYISIRIICQRSITRSSTRAVAVWQMSCVALLLRNLVIEKVQREGLDDNVWSATSSDKVWKAMFSWVVWSQTRALYLLLQCTKAAKGNPDTYYKKHRLCAKVHFWAGRMIKGAWKLFCMLRPMTSITNLCETQFSKQKEIRAWSNLQCCSMNRPSKRRLNVINTWINEYWWYLMWLQIQISSHPLVMEERS